MNDNQNMKQFFKGAFILTMAGLISKILSAGYRIPLQNIAGDLGFYIYQQIYPFLGVAMVLSLYGFPVAVSKLVADYREEGRSLSIKAFYGPVIGVLLFFCVGMFFALYTQADEIAALMGDKKLNSPLKAAAYVFLVIPVTSLLRGVFQGEGDMKPTALSQMAEQLLRVAIILLSAIYLIDHTGIYGIGIGAAFGSIAGTLTAGVFLTAVFLKKKPWQRVDQRQVSFFYYIKTIFLYGVFICLNYMFLLLIQMVDALTLVPALENFGVETDIARVMKGVFDRGQPLIQLGTVLGSSLALALIPTITAKRMEEHPDTFQSHLQSALKASLYIASGATVGLIVLFPYVNILLFQDASGTEALRVLMAVILLGSLAITTSSILQGLDMIYFTAGAVLAGVSVKWGMNYLLVPIFGLTGAASASVLGAGVMLALNVRRMHKRIPKKIWHTLPYAKLAMSLAGMVGILIAAITVESLFLNLASRISILVFTLAVTLAGASIFFVILVINGGLHEREVKQLPHGEWIHHRLIRGKRNG
ncbi:putative polysaccharide biosynthesis protein [Thalassobacillus pellis]|uniref:putative polysaccharide biosynthesis protein n=1 Tax=Thalassobacillus pellis TaxID=748008 RepID=UPI001961C30F|nr:polysaccharide biosynthesis protein [Thalassobacillus pellis]MBM7555133.1 PST family polysaccharide transporter [Thalassobacillus pellis]